MTDLDDRVTADSQVQRDARRGSLGPLLTNLGIRRRCRLGLASGLAGGCQGSTRPMLQEEAVKTVLAQAELLCAEWV